MKHTEVIETIKFSKYQALWLVVLILAIFTPVTNLIRQAILNDDYRWFLLFFIVASYIIWNFIRPVVFMMFGIPAIEITKHYIRLRQLGYEIEWADIDEMNLNISSGKTTTYTLVITVKDPWKYISMVKNPLMRYYRWYAKDYFYTPFAVSLSGLEGDSQGIYDNIESYFHQYRRIA